MQNVVHQQDIGSALTSIFGKYKFIRMPFGLAQGPTYFTTIMQTVLGTFHIFCFSTSMTYFYVIQVKRITWSMVK